ncbi:tail fiber domain-containing protein [Neorhizobium alkalisoli]|uniref:Endosialidase-like protein n=1 Tax=Neorhizobium alkalisoli TaxID=528178 RepID=A0A561Q7J6_9HYPH|nr:tail fiber domain-containing protein [Neorhizobium alkalisoli]TWF46332.1 endosialidase-like protein [Neorhizobium alkalisoli]
MTIAGSINTAGLTSSTAISSTGSVTGAGLISTGGISATGNIALAAGAERQISFGDFGGYLYGNSSQAGLYYPAGNKSPWYYNKTNDLVNFQAGSLQHNGTTVVTNSGGTYSINITGNAGGNAATATTATNANRLLLNGSGYTNFNWAGQGGQPTWLWGGNDAGNMYVYNPSNFSVNYANGAGNANTLGGLSNAYFMQRLTNTNLTDNEGYIRFFFAGNGQYTVIRGGGDPIVRFQNSNGSNAAQIRSGGTYENLSDRRTKYDIVDATDIGRDQLMALRPRWYKRIGIDKVELGWISQEVREALPIAVQPINPDDPDELLYIDEKAISVATVATLKEVVAELEMVKAELAALKAERA